MCYYCVQSFERHSKAENDTWTLNLRLNQFKSIKSELTVPFFNNVFDINELSCDKTNPEVKLDAFKASSPVQITAVCILLSPVSVRCSRLTVNQPFAHAQNSPQRPLPAKQCSLTTDKASYGGFNQRRLIKSVPPSLLQW